MLRKENDHKWHESACQMKIEMENVISKLHENLDLVKHEAKNREYTIGTQLSKVEKLYFLSKNELSDANHKLAGLENRAKKLNQHVLEKVNFAQRCKEQLVKIVHSNTKYVESLMDEKSKVLRENERSKRKVEDLLLNFQRMKQYFLMKPGQHNNEAIKYLRHLKYQNKQFANYLKIMKERIVSYEELITKLKKEVSGMVEQALKHRKREYQLEHVKSEAKEELALLDTERSNLLSKIDSLSYEVDFQKNQLRGNTSELLRIEALKKDLEKGNETKQKEIDLLRTKAKKDATEYQQLVRSKGLIVINEDVNNCIFM